MKNMVLKKTNGSSITTILCKLDHSSSLRVLSRFIDARLLHFPGDRTRKEVMMGAVLQPTAKGIFLLSRCHARQGLEVESLKSLLASRYNSMECFTFDRRPQTDAIVTSECLVHLLFEKFMGKEPNFYDPGESGKNHSGQCSPYAHRYYTHPDSDALTQYYNSRGVRLFANHQVGGGTRVPWCFTGRAAFQWLVECTDAMSSREACDIANTFVRNGLVVRIGGDEREHRMDFSKNSFYQLTEKGKHVCKWTRNANDVVTSSKALTDCSLDMVLEDAGLRQLFRQHLEKDFCQENLNFYTDFQRFKSEYRRHQGGHQKSTTTAIYTLTDRYLSSGAPQQLNLNSQLSSEISKAIRRLDTSSSEAAEKCNQLLSQIECEVYKMMETDSLPKFLKSQEFEMAKQIFAYQLS